MESKTCEICGLPGGGDLSLLTTEVNLENPNRIIHGMKDCPPREIGMKMFRDGKSHAQVAAVIGTLADRL